MSLFGFEQPDLIVSEDAMQHRKPYYGLTSDELVLRHLSAYTTFAAQATSPRRFLDQSGSGVDFDLPPAKGRAGMLHAVTLRIATADRCRHFVISVLVGSTIIRIVRVSRRRLNRAVLALVNDVAAATR